MALTTSQQNSSPYADLHVNPYAERHIKVYADSSIPGATGGYGSVASPLSPTTDIVPANARSRLPLLTHDCQESDGQYQW
jgi:hypothetical protein